MYLARGDRITKIRLRRQTLRRVARPRVVHFLITPDTRAADVRQGAAASAGGHVLVSTFAPRRAQQSAVASMVVRLRRRIAAQQSASASVGATFEGTAQTPFGTTQQFDYCYCRGRMSAVSKLNADFFLSARTAGEIALPQNRASTISETLRDTSFQSLYLEAALSEKRTE